MFKKTDNYFDSDFVIVTVLNNKKSTPAFILSKRTGNQQYFIMFLCRKVKIRYSSRITCNSLKQNYFIIFFVLTLPELSAFIMNTPWGKLAASITRLFLFEKA